MTRRLRIEWSPGSKVTGLLSGPGEGELGILLAHGAGAGQRHPFMEGLRRRLAAAGMPTLTFDYPYMESGRRAPDRLDRLIECHRAVHRRFSQRVRRVVVAGKSMGGRVGGHLVAEHGAGAIGMVFFGYPLLPIGSSDPRPTTHLEECQAPALFIQGERDRMGPPDLVGEVANRHGNARLEVVAEANHGFSVPKRTGLGPEDVLDRLAGLTLGFVKPLA